MAADYISIWMAPRRARTVCSARKTRASTRAHLRPGDRLAIRGANQVEGHVLRVVRDGMPVDWGGRLGTVRHTWSEVGARFVGWRGGRWPGVTPDPTVHPTAAAPTRTVSHRRHPGRGADRA